MTTPNDALDFYPTPDSLAFDMVFSLREVKSGFTTYPKPILEPSAGDGALAPILATDTVDPKKAAVAVLIAPMKANDEIQQVCNRLFA